MHWFEFESEPGIEKQQFFLMCSWPFSSYTCFSLQLFLILQDINHVYYETEFRTEWCSNNSTMVTCFLFARKFSKGAAMRLLSDGVVGHFDVSTLLSNSEP